MRIFNYIDKFLVVGTSTSIILSLILFYTGTDSLSSLSIGLLGTILTLQIDQIARAEQKNVEDSAKLELLRKIEDTRENKDLLIELINYTFIIVNNIDNPFFKSQTKIETEKLRDFLLECSKGKLKLPSGHNDFIIEALEKTKETFMVTSPHTIDYEWWETARGKKFWDANVEAIQRGIRIVRIFIIVEPNEKIEKTFLTQHKSGVEVYYIKASETPIELRYAFGVFDKFLSYELTQTFEGTVSGYTFSINQADIRRVERMMERLLFFSIKFEDKITQ